MLSRAEIITKTTGSEEIDEFEQISKQIGYPKAPEGKQNNCRLRRFEQRMENKQQYL